MTVNSNYLEPRVVQQGGRDLAGEVENLVGELVAVTINPGDNRLLYVDQVGLLSRIAEVDGRFFYRVKSDCSNILFPVSAVVDVVPDNLSTIVIEA